MARRTKTRADPFVRFQKPASVVVTALLFPLLIIASVPTPVLWARLLEGVIESLVIIAVVLSVAATPLRRRVLATCAAATLVVGWIRLIYPTLLSETADVVQALLFLMVIFELATDIFEKQGDRTGRLLSALNLYVLGAVAFARIYGLIEAAVPNSFRAPDAGPMVPSAFVYYSFTTQTTLGFGDIVPALPLARAFSVVQATLGVLYLAVIVAAIIGGHGDERGRAHETRSS